MLVYGADMVFNAREIADRALSEGGDPLAELVGQYGGFTSVCWENMAGAGVFQSEDAAAATDQVVAWIRDHMTVKVGPEQRLVLVVRPSGGEDLERLKLAVGDIDTSRVIAIDADMLRTAYVVDGEIEVDDDEPRLGCATTAHLVDELAARVEVAKAVGEDWPAYRTVGE